jgi:hypothetical protein
MTAVRVIVWTVVILAACHLPPSPYPEAHPCEDAGFDVGVGVDLERRRPRPSAYVTVPINLYNLRCAQHLTKVGE